MVYLSTDSRPSSSSLFDMHHQCVAPLAANSPHSGLSRAISIASSKVRLCRDRSFFWVAIQEVRVAIQEEWGRPTGLLQSLWGTAMKWNIQRTISWSTSSSQLSPQRLDVITAHNLSPVKCDSGNAPQSVYNTHSQAEHTVDHKMFESSQKFIMLRYTSTMHYKPWWNVNIT